MRQVPTAARYEPETKTIRSVPENYWLASLDSFEGAVDHEATARMFAAAPAMVAALREAIRWINRTAIADSNPPEYLAMVAAVRAAQPNACPEDGNMIAEDGVCGFCGNEPDAYGPTLGAEADSQWLQIDYHCPACEHDWQEEWSCACDSECPQCGARDIEASDWRDAA